MVSSTVFGRAWFVGLLLMVGVQLIVGVMLDGHVLASASQSESAHDRGSSDAGRTADLMDEAQDDSAAGPNGGHSPPLPDLSGLRSSHLLLPGQLQFMAGPFRPPRLFQ
jgi:hypothetical protein